MRTSPWMEGGCGVLLGLICMGLGAGTASCAASNDDPGPDPGDDDGTDVDAAPGTPDATSGGDDILPENMIDDLDDGDPALLKRGGRIGSWYTYNDMTATGEQTPAMGEPFMPAPGGAGGSPYAANTHGTGFTVWGSGMGFDLNNQMNVKAVYSAAAFTGIAFKAKGSGPVRAAVMIAGVISSEVGGQCVPGAGTTDKCDDGHGSLLFLTSDWKTFKLPFASLQQAGWGKPVVFDSTQIMSIQFNVDKNLAFDFSIDDIGFY